MPVIGRPALILIDMQEAMAGPAAGPRNNPLAEEGIEALLAAWRLGFSVTVVSDATFTFDKRDFNGVLRSAEEVHAMSLVNLAGEYASIADTSEALRALVMKQGDAP